MKLYKSAEMLHSELRATSKKGLSIGFIPTMGALHAGHLSLVQRAREENDTVICSIFVNPKQFDEASDLDKYPRPIEEDLEMLRKVGVDIVFHPEAKVMYPDEFNDLKIDLNGLDLVLEGKQRPGHFQGVAKVVKRLFEITVPHRVYFGQKDFQQTVVVRHLIHNFFPDTHLVVCPIIRESHGLAMSSRNVRLSSENRIKASFIYKSLLKLKERCNFKSLKEAIDSTTRYLESIDNAELEYLKAVDGYSMKVVESLDDAEYVVVVTVVKYHGVRLLDNLVLKQPNL